MNGVLREFDVIVHFQDVPSLVKLDDSCVSISVQSTMKFLELKRRIFKVSMIPPYLQNVYYRVKNDGDSESGGGPVSLVGSNEEIMIDDLVVKGVVADKSLILAQIENKYIHDPEIHDFLSNFQFHQEKCEEVERLEARNPHIERLIGAEERGPLLLIFQFLSPLYIIRSLMFVNKSFYNVSKVILNFTSSSKYWENRRHLPLLCGSLNYISEEFLNNLIFNFPNFQDRIEDIKINYYGLSISLPEYCIYRKFHNLFFYLTNTFEWKSAQVFNFSTLRTAIHGGNESVIDYILKKHQIDLIQPPNKTRDDEKFRGRCFEGERIVYDYMIRNNHFDLIEQELRRIEDLKRSENSTGDEYQNYQNIFISFLAQNLDVYSSVIPFSRIIDLHKISKVDVRYLIQYLVQHMEVVDWCFLEGFMTHRMEGILYCDDDMVTDGTLHQSYARIIQSQFIPAIRNERFEEFGKFITSSSFEEKEKPPWILGVIYGPRIMLEYYGCSGDLEGIKKVFSRDIIIYDCSKDFNRLSYNREYICEVNLNPFFSPWREKKQPYPIRFRYENMDVKKHEECLKLLLPRFEISIETFRIWLGGENKEDNVTSTSDILPIFNLFIDLMGSSTDVICRKFFFSDVLVEIISGRKFGSEIILEYMDRIEKVYEGVEWRKEFLETAIRLGHSEVTRRIIEQRMRLGTMKIITDDIFEICLKKRNTRVSASPVISNEILELLFSSIVRQFDLPGSGRVDFLSSVFEHAYTYNSQILLNILRRDEGWGRPVILNAFYSRISEEEQTPLIRFLRGGGGVVMDFECVECGCKIGLLEENVFHRKDYFVRKNVKNNSLFGNFMSDDCFSSDSEEEEVRGEEEDRKDEIFVVCKDCA